MEKLAPLNTIKELTLLYQKLRPHLDSSPSPTWFKEARQTLVAIHQLTDGARTLQEIKSKQVASDLLRMLQNIPENTKQRIAITLEREKEPVPSSLKPLSGTEDDETRKRLQPHSAST